MQGLVEGRLDIGVMYTPESRPGLKVELLFDERLVLVSTEPGRKPEPGPGYVYIDWGPEFFARHSASFPDFFGSSLTANIGWLGLQHVLENGGSGYFPIRLVAPASAKRQARRAFRMRRNSLLSAYVVYPTDAAPDVAGPRVGRHSPRRRRGKPAGYDDGIRFFFGLKAAYNSTVRPSSCRTSRSRRMPNFSSER